MGLIILQNRNAKKKKKKSLWKNVKEKDPLEDLGVDGRKHENEC